MAQVRCDHFGGRAQFPCANCGLIGIDADILLTAEAPFGGIGT